MTNSTSRYTRAFLRRLRALTREVPGARAGDVESVHRLRVASRRLREALAALHADGAAPVPKPARLRRQVRRLTRALGGVRELDVSLGLVDELAEAHPDLAGALGRLHRRIARERIGHRAQMLRALERIDPSGVSRRIRVLVAETDTPIEHLRRRDRLAERLEVRTERLAREVDAAGRLYAPHRLHPVRIAAKKLRYALELAREFHGVPTLAVNRRVKRIQDLLGRLHDFEVLVGWTRTSRGSHGRFASECRGLAALIDAEIVRLHADYLKHHSLLWIVVGRCQADILPALRANLPAASSQHPGRTGAEVA